MKKQQCIHVGNRGEFKPYISLPNQSSLVEAPSLEYERSGADQRIPYPRDTKAFLYYSLSPEKPRITGELRLRVTSSDDPASFESGSDLLRTDGLPWSRPLHILSKLYPPLYEKMREDQLIPDDLDRVLGALPERKIQYSRNQFLYTLNDTIYVDFGTHSPKFRVITEQGMESILCRGVFFDGREMYSGAPYTGARHSSPSLDPMLIILINL